MKFGRKISTDLYNEWRPFYIDYNRLKRELKDRTLGRHWTTQDEKAFTLELEKELDKVHDFQKAKISELSRRIREAEKSVKVLVAQDSVPHSPGEQGKPGETTQQSPHCTPREHRRHRHPKATIDHSTNGQQPATSSADPERQGSNAPLYAQDDGSESESESGSVSGETDTDSEDGHDIDMDTDDSYDALEARFHALEEEVATLVADVHDLALYTKLNITGFMKILKKHDKQTSMPLKPAFINTYLAQRPFYKYNWDALIVKLSRLYDLVRTRGHPVEGDAAAGAGQSAFVRQTTKYWVHPDNLVPLKLAILRNLPVLVFDANKEYEPKDSAITSIYFDNEDLELYLGRLEKTEGAEAIRLRWYGDMDVKTIFVERKTHREDWTGEKSVKARFPLKEHLVNAFLSGEYSVDQLAEEWQGLVKRGKKTQQEVDSMIQLASEVQYRVVTKKLVPVVRTFYNRTAFQLPGDARVRISLDTELTMVREDNWDGHSRSGNNWRRTDIGIDYPFEQIPDDDKELFKYGVLEVKLQTQFGQEPPKWVTDLVQSHLVEAVPKFSKFIHGCATLLPNRVDLVPFWLPQMETDILKPNTGYLAVIERPSQVPSMAAKASSSSRSMSESSQTQVYAEPLSEGEEDEDFAMAPAHDEDKRTGLTGKEVEEAIAYRQQMLKEQELLDNDKDEIKAGKRKKPLDAREGNAGINVPEDDEDSTDDDDVPVADERTPFLKSRPGSIAAYPGAKADSLSIDPLAPSSTFDQQLRDHMRGKIRDRELTTVDEDGDGLGDDENDEADELEGQRLGGDRVLVRNLRAPQGKRIAVPVRIEPKVYFAAERTFLKWLNIAVFIGTIATTLLNFVPPQDSRGLISAAVFTLAALIAIAYAGIVFVYRTIRIRQRRAEGLYYDRYGPTLLCVVLLGAVMTNIGLRASEM